MKVLVTDGNNRAALAITRSLGKVGYDVIVGSEELPCLASTSKYCCKSFLYPSPQKKSGLFSKKISYLTPKTTPKNLRSIIDSKVKPDPVFTLRVKHKPYSKYKSGEI